MVMVGAPADAQRSTELRAFAKKTWNLFVDQ
jgi:hypothetical protein